jgi:hypothetical protein
MKKFALTFMVLLVGCNTSSQIGVTRLDPQSGVSSPQPQPGVAPAGVTSSDSQPSSTIFFEQIRQRDGQAPIINGIGFLDRDAEITDPFIVQLAQEVAVSDEPAFVPVSGGALIYDRSSSNGTLRLLDLETLSSTDLSEIDGAVSVASTPGHATIGWVDTQGDAYLSKGNHRQKLNLGSSSLKAKRIGTAGSNSQFYVLAQSDSSKILLFAPDSPEPLDSFVADQLAVSPKGDRFLIVNGNSAEVYNPSTKLSKSLPISGSIREPAWQDEKTISYWTESSGKISIELFNTETSQRTEVTTLNASMNTAGMICPIWNQGALYFADRRDGKNIILRAHSASGIWAVSSFAEPTDSRFGLICPSVSNYF